MSEKNGVSEKKIGSPHKRKHLFYYGFMAFPLAFAGLPVYVHAPDFYTTTFGLSLSLIGVTLMLLRIIDAVQDPFIGHISDVFHARRRQIILVGLLLLGLGFWMLFHPPGYFVLLWFCLSILICTTGFSIVSINFQALGSLWPASPPARTRITAWREALGLAGLLVAALLPSLLGGSQKGFHFLTLLYIPLLILASLTLFRWMRYTRLSLPADKGLRPLSFSLLNNSWVRQFFGIYLLNSVASAIPAVLVIFFVRDRLDGESFLGLFLLLYFLSGIISMLVWQYLARLSGKKEAWLMSMGVAVMSFFWAGFLQPGDLAAYGVICFLSGFALGADLALPPAIIADRIVNFSEQLAASRYFAFFALIAKSALALATGLALPLLGWLGYQPGLEVDERVAGHLATVYAFIPSFLKMLTAFWLWQFLKNNNKNSKEIL